MEDALLVRRVQARAELARDLDGLVDGETPDPLEERREVFAVDVLHREEMAPFDLADVVDAADVRVRDLPREPDLRMEAREEALVGRDGLGQELQGDRLPELQVVGAIDLAHAALSEKPDDPVALAEHGAGRKGPEVDGARRDDPPDRGGGLRRDGLGRRAHLGGEVRQGPRQGLPARRAEAARCLHLGVAVRTARHDFCRDAISMDPDEPPGRASPGSREGRSLCYPPPLRWKRRNCSLEKTIRVEVGAQKTFHRERPPATALGETNAAHTGA